MVSGSRQVSSLVLLMLSAAAVVSAGGWVVITVENLPDQVVVGKPVTLTYTVRQHGNKLTSGLDGRIEARSSRHVVEAPAIATAEQGRYTASLTLPASGEWTISIDSGFGGNFDSSRLVLPAIADNGPWPAVSEADRGQRLFAAKGCATCHTHPAVEEPSVAAAPALGFKRYQATYLSQFLAHPPKARSDKGEMPNLNLQEAEIASLVAFINASGKS
jgi:cytochrome c553